MLAHTHTTHKHPQHTHPYTHTHKHIHHTHMQAQHIHAYHTQHIHLCTHPQMHKFTHTLIQINQTHIHITHRCTHALTHTHTYTHRKKEKKKRKIRERDRRDDYKAEGSTWAGNTGRSRACCLSQGSAQAFTMQPTSSRINSADSIHDGSHRDCNDSNVVCWQEETARNPERLMAKMMKRKSRAVSASEYEVGIGGTRLGKPP